MARPVVAAQMYTCRDFCQTPEQIVESVKKIAKIGYTALQASGMKGLEAMGHEEFRKVCDGEGVKICCTHISYADIKNDIQRVIAEHQIMGCMYPGIGGAGMEYYGSEADAIRFANEASELAQQMYEEAGLRFIYHNHSTEFACPPDSKRTILEIFEEESDPRYFNFELDTYWVAHGGGSPVAWINAVAGRCPVLHYKDYAITIDRVPFYTEIGEGNLDWPGIIWASEQAGCEYAAVEQDICPGDPFDSLEISYKNLCRMGLR